MTALLRRLFVEEALLKAVSLVFAVVLFVVVRSDKDATTGAFVKVLYALPKDRVLVSDPVTELRVVVRGPWTRVSRLQESDLDPVRVDLSRLPPGDLRFNEEMVHLPVGLRVASISPPQARIAFEPRVERQLPIQPILGGEPASGYRVARSTAQPAKVRVTGAKSVVEGLQRVPTRPFLIAEARGPVRGEATLDAPPPHATFEGPTSVEIEVEVVAVLAERTLRAVPIQVTGLQRLEGHVEPAVAEVVLRGPGEALSRVAPGAPSLLIDAQAEEGRPQGTYRKRIAVTGLPANVAAEIRPESVSLITRRRR